jgi:hypothetical protein
MAYRRFEDRDGKKWEVLDRSFSQWEFRPVEGNTGDVRRARAPGYEKDPFELSVEELQRLLDSAPASSRPTKKSPFRD